MRHLPWILSALALAFFVALRARRRTSWTVTREDGALHRARPYMHRSIGSRFHGRGEGR